jgi:hypothetical protein
LIKLWILWISPKNCCGCSVDNPKIYTLGHLNTYSYPLHKM